MRHYFSITLLILCQVAIGQQTIFINPDVKYQTLEGWGISLSWWAHDVGDKFSDEDLDVFCRWLTDPDELNMNVFRYNISGGDDPSHNHMRPDAQVPGYKTAEFADHDWSRNAAQRNILLKVNAMRPDAIYEAANYSPPYWMTKSGCSAGDSLGLDNLKDDYYDDFARYLADVVRYYKAQHNITFSSISPVNEPFSNWWKAGGTQEGCAFSQENQEKIIRELYLELKKHDMLSYTGIAVMDANSIDECLKGLMGYEKAGILSMIKQINVHSYAGTQRKELNAFANRHQIPLWQSESGPLWVEKKGPDNFLFMAQRIVTDMKELKPVVWCDWQYMGRGFGGVWSLVGYNLGTKAYERTMGYYCRKQFTHLIKQGYTFIENDNENTLTAISPDQKTMVVVIVNQHEKDKEFNIDFGASFKPKKASLFRTSETENYISISDDRNIDFENYRINCKRKSVTSIVLEGK
ncbi:MAG: glycoside hydrolase [Paludibacter sp.]|jgi:O-glycosyl hydrolase